MQLIKVETKELLKYINIAFDGDDELLKYYDKSSKVCNTLEMADDTFNKILDYHKHFKECNSYKVILDGNDIGYLFLTLRPNLLISFSLNRNYRSAENLKNYFNCIKNSFRGDFNCYLNSHNDRAIDWLKKCGMVDYDLLNIGVLNLKYKICP